MPLHGSDATEARNAGGPGPDADRPFLGTCDRPGLRVREADRDVQVALDRGDDAPRQAVGVAHGRFADRRPRVLLVELRDAHGPALDGERCDGETAGAAGCATGRCRRRGRCGRRQGFGGRVQEDRLRPVRLGRRGHPAADPGHERQDREARTEPQRPVWRCARRRRRRSGATPVSERSGRPAHRSPVPCRRRGPTSGRAASSDPPVRICARTTCTDVLIGRCSTRRGY